jgi:hypothetical protein
MKTVLPGCGQHCPQFWVDDLQQIRPSLVMFFADMHLTCRTSTSSGWSFECFNSTSPQPRVGGP